MPRSWSRPVRRRLDVVVEPEHIIGVVLGLDRREVCVMVGTESGDDPFVTLPPDEVEVAGPLDQGFMSVRMSRTHCVPRSSSEGFSQMTKGWMAHEDPRPEQVRVLVLTGVDGAAVGGHQLHGEQIVAGQADHAVETVRESSYPGSPGAHASPVSSWREDGQSRVSHALGRHDGPLPMGATGPSHRSPDTEDMISRSPAAAEGDRTRQGEQGHARQNGGRAPAIRRRPPKPSAAAPCRSAARD
jgi:hypothetical protein